MPPQETPPSTAQKDALQQNHSTQNHSTKETEEATEKKNKQTNSEKKTITKPITQQKNQQDPQVQDLTSALQHLQADFENYKKRVARDQEGFKQFAKKEFILTLLPIVDAFDLAIQDLQELAKGEQEEQASTTRKGIELIYAQLHTLLEKEGVQMINSINQLYDPHLHEAIMTEKTTDEKKKNKVIEEFQKGYTMHGYLLRPSKVKIAI